MADPQGESRVRLKKAVRRHRALSREGLLERMFERLGIAAEMKAKTLLEPGSVQAAEKVVAGEAEVAEVAARAEGLRTGEGLWALGEEQLRSGLAR